MARWTDQAQLDAGKRCVAHQSDGMIAAGVPIGTDSFSKACLREKVASQERAQPQPAAPPRSASATRRCVAYLLLR